MITLSDRQQRSWDKAVAEANKYNADYEFPPNINHSMWVKESQMEGDIITAVYMDEDYAVYIRMDYYGSCHMYVGMVNILNDPEDDDD